ncbi:MAG: PQQ-dependent sugar dehydrogenase [Chitinophagaceae bacterium]|nr:PQQ-dependent sugar dehydrogenase [Chitinophagaceae bacterium]
MFRADLLLSTTVAACPVRMARRYPSSLFSQPNKITALLILCFLCITFGVFSQKPIKLIEIPITLKNKTSFKLKVPTGYKINAAVEGLSRPRFFAKSPDGRLFVTDMYDRSDNKRGKIIILENWNDATREFEKVTPFMEELHNPNQVAFYQLKGQWHIYIAETHQLSYYVYNNGDSKPTGTAKVIATFPDYGLSYKYGGWHLTRSIAFHNDKLYVSVGSSCDACIEKEEIRATISEMNPADGSNKKIIARGVRNAVGMKWVNNELWATNMGRDNRGPDKPEEQLMKIIPGAFYGWPYYFQYKKQIIADPDFKDSVHPKWVKRPPISKWAIKAHSAPLGFAYFIGFKDSLLNNSFITALHGSTSVWRQRGNSVVQMLPNGTYREIVTGFLQGTTEEKRFGRPCDVMQWDDRSFFISDDKNGVIYYVRKEK